MPLNFSTYNLKLIRNDLGLSQQELSDIIKVSRTRLSRIENYKEKLSFNQLTNLKDFVPHVDKYKIVEKQDAQVTDTQSTLALDDKLTALYEIIQLKDQIISSKNDQINLLLKQSSSFPLPTSSYATPTQEKGELINWNLMDLSSDIFTEVILGFQHKLVNNKNQINKDLDEVYHEYLNIDFRRFNVMLCEAKKNAHFKVHYHMETQYIICVEGAFINLTDNSLIIAGKSIRFDCFEPHEIKIIDDCKMIILLDKYH